MILWWGKKKQPDPKTGETPIEPLSRAEPEQPSTEPPKQGFIARLAEGLRRSSSRLAEGVAAVFRVGGPRAGHIRRTLEVFAHRQFVCW